MPFGISVTDKESCLFVRASYDPCSEKMCKFVGTNNIVLSKGLSLSCTGEGNGNPLQCSCLENPRDREPGGLPSMGSHRVGYD